MSNTLGIFARMKIYLKENKISTVHSNLCKKSFRIDGKIGKFGVGCNAILCPPGHVRSKLWQERIDGGCVKWLNKEAAPYWGSTNCGLNQPD